ncbi:hypothetical protein [Nonomuraea sp. NPDC049709]|uniref:hypothetical protein n=1 Tax=Nonomuraea sp. NPDC049709 TaxID=3154736 RepID=UPI0034274B55
MVTAPVVVIPYAVWAWRRLRRAGVPVHAGRSGLVALPLVLAGVHALAHALVRRRPTRPTTPGDAGNASDHVRAAPALVRRRGRRS